jgi:hypothetical protein
MNRHVRYGHATAATLRLNATTRTSSKASETTAQVALTRVALPTRLGHRGLTS